MASFLDRMRGRGAVIAKASKLSEELDRLDALLARQERQIREAFADFVKDVRSPAVIREVTALIQAGNIEGALQIVDTYVTRMGSAIPAIFQRAAIAEAAALAGDLARLAPRVAIAFDPTDPVAADLMRRASLEFVREFTDKQRQAVRVAISEALLRGGGAVATARAFRDAIGLTAYQEGVVRNYRALLERGSLEALDRQLRDGRFQPKDDSLAARRKYLENLTPAQIDKMVERYRERMIRRRGETIASTEALRVTAEARDEAFRQAAAAAGLDLNLVDEIWNSTRDTRTRETHRAMNRQVRPYGVAFDSPSGAQLRYPGDPLAPADEVINCRCHKTRRIRQEGEPFGTPLAETP
jgi:hypothetical protein